MNKKGGAIAEAAIVFPVVIAVVVTLIYILITLYVDASYTARDHIALRIEAGRLTETVGRADGLREVTPFDRFGSKPFYEQAVISEGSNSILLFKQLTTDRGSLYAIKETNYIRKVDFAARILFDD
jgi:hypothetical protein